MRKKIINPRFNEATLHKRIQRQSEYYHKLWYRQKSTHEKVLAEIDNQLKKTQASYSLKKDYRDLKDLLRYNRKLHFNRQKSMKCYKDMYEINSKQNSQKLFDPIKKQIRNTSVTADRYKHNIKKLQQLPFRTFKQKKVSPSQKEQFPNLIIELLERKNITEDHLYHNEKFNLLGDVSLQIKKDYQKQIKRLFQRYYQNQKDIPENQKQYIINHFILQKFFERVYENTGKIKLKEKYKSLYSQIKRQMVKELIQEQKSTTILQNLLQYEQNHQVECKKKLKKKKSYIFYQHRQDTNFTKSFEEIFNNAYQKIEQAFKDFQSNKPKPKKENFRSKLNKFLP